MKTTTSEFIDLFEKTILQYEGKNINQHTPSLVSDIVFLLKKALLQHEKMLENDAETAILQQDPIEVAESIIEEAKQREAAAAATTEESSPTEEDDLDYAKLITEYLYSSMKVQQLKEELVREKLRIQEEFMKQLPLLTEDTIDSSNELPTPQEFESSCLGEQ